ncbi:MAG: sigma-70 family RNA polymerase sigma factor [Anditalea sp.]
MRQPSSIRIGYSGKQSQEIKNEYKDEAAIWEAFKRGNESSFIYIYEAYFDPLFIYGNQFTKNKDLIKDAIQDLFIELRKDRHKLGRTDSIKFYLFKCLKRKIIRESSQWFHQCEEFSGDFTFDFTFSHEQVLIDKQLDDEKVAQLNRAIKALSPRKREVIYYFYYEGLDYQQIQEIMQLSHIKSARNLVYKAVDFLREYIK